MVGSINEKHGNQIVAFRTGESAVSYTHLDVYKRQSMDKLKALAKIYDVSLDWLCSDTTDGKSLEEVVVPVEDNGTSNATKSAENKKKIRYAVIALVAGVIILTCTWFATKPKNNEMDGTQFEDMENEVVDIPDQVVSGFDFEWED